ncbi:MAG: acetyl-CoA decarbonylase/synthase complex subunit delta [Methanomicrobiaceae archaeon]|nr:acetyl-CoA decarbonylase/synthase complex subunit delta [Methanomicrobiaceae archaeon]
MSEEHNPEQGNRILEVSLGATTAEGGTRERVYTVGGAGTFPFLGAGPAAGHPPRIALEICDDTRTWSPIVLREVGDLAGDTGAWAAAAETTFGADMVRLFFTSTRQRGFDDFASLGTTMEEVIGATKYPLIVEGSTEPGIDSEVYRRIGEAAEGERILLGTAEADRYRSVAASALAYGHALVAQTPIDINLAKQLNILLHETGLPPERIVIDPYTGTLGYGFEYSYSVMERIRSVALQGDADLARPMISSAIDSLNVKEVREADPETADEVAIRWEFYAAFSALVAGAEIVCVRHPGTVALLREALPALQEGSHPQEEAYGDESA